MPKSHTKQQMTDLRPIIGSAFATNWRGEVSACSFCPTLATHVASMMVASAYSAEPGRKRYYRLCPDHAAKHA